MLTVNQALNEITTHVCPAHSRSLSLDAVLGTVLAEAVASQVDSPPFDKAMMDGYAVRSADLVSGAGTLQVVGELAAGSLPETSVGPGTAIRIMTGSPIPDGADAVVPVEWTKLLGDEVSIQSPGKPIAPGLNIVEQGTAMSRGDVVLSGGELIRAPQLALLAEAGITNPVVRPLPRVAVLATGNELVPADQTPGPGQIRNTNALMLTAQLQQMGAEAVDLGIARDEQGDLRAKIGRGLEADFLILSGGVSAGVYDLVPSQLAAAGVREIFHKIAMKPGKPVWFGVAREGTDQPCYVFGLPGNPVSSLVCCELFVAAALRQWKGVSPAAPPLIKAKLVADFSQRGDRETWFPGRLFAENGELWVRTVDWKGSFDLRSPAMANASVRFPPGDQRWEKESLMEVLPWSGGPVLNPDNGVSKNVDP